MSQNKNFYDPDQVDAMVKSEIEFRKRQGIAPIRPTVILDKELPWGSDNTRSSYVNIANNPYAGPKLNAFQEFEAQQNAEKATKRRDENSKRDIMIKQNTLLDELPRHLVTATKIYPYSPGEIRKISVVNVQSPNKENGLTHGLFDDRMGVIKRGELCVTCNLDDKGCGGHIGHIDLPEKIVLPIFKKKCILTLKCICPFCGELYIEKFFKALNLDKVPEHLLLPIVAELSEKWFWKLHNHGIARHVYENDFRGSKLLFSVDVPGGGEKKYVRSISNIEKMFTLVPREKFAMLGFTGDTQPINFLTDVIVCSPSCIRPSNKVNGKIMDHMLTTLYAQILTRIIRINSHNGTTVDRDNELDSLYTDIETIAMGPEKKTGVKVALKDAGIAKGLGTKKGLTRGNMQGKRVNHNARCVGAPGCPSAPGDPEGIHVGEVGISAYVAKNTMIPVKVHKYNIDRVIEEYRRGEFKMITMKLLSSSGAFTINEAQIREYTPVIGDTLIRSLKTGDAVTCGRQPSLQAESNLGYNCVVIQNDTIAIHSSNNSCFNADFDGDEFNAHFLQLIRAQVEAMTVMNFKSHIMNLQANRPMMAASFHGLIGPYLATKVWTVNGVKTEVILPEKRFREAISLLNPSYRTDSLEARLKRHGINPRSGRALFSAIFPTNFTYSGSGLEIIDGILVKGTFKKSNIGLSVLSLVQILTKMYSIKEGCRFINDIQILADWFVMWHGLSIGYKDFNVGRKRIRKLIKNNLNKMQLEIFNLGPRPKGGNDLFFWMRSLFGILERNKDFVNANAAKCLRENNALVVLGKEGCGAKGSEANTTNAIGCLGTQFVGASIPEYELKNNTRCYPFFVSNDVSFESIGYVSRSYMDGISLTDVLFHNGASRITLIDTAKNVSKIGHIHRRIEKSVEPIKISWLGMVVSTDGRMFQPLFGSGFDVSKSMPVKTARSGERIWFCNFKDEAEMLCRIYERKHFGDDYVAPKDEAKPTIFEEFKAKNSRFPKFSEIDSDEYCF